MKPARTPHDRRRRIRHHVNPLQVGASRLHPQVEIPICAHLPSPVEVEFGCADGEFLFQRVRKHPDTQYVGIEIRPEMVRRVNRRSAKEKLPQLQAILANLNSDLPALFQEGQIDIIFINFPDPWFKKKQHKRRLVQADWIEGAISFLKPGGELFFQSDIFELALDAMCVFEQTKELFNLAGPWSFFKENPYEAKSLREIRVEEDGLPVWRIRYRRMGSKEP